MPGHSWWQHFIKQPNTERVIEMILIIYLNINGAE